MSKIVTFNISVPTQEGFLGRACNASDCGQYFKIHIDCRKENMYCPYCAQKFSENELHTSDQEEYILEAAKEEAFVYAQKELQKVLKDTFGRPTSRKSGISFSYKPGKIKKRTVAPKYSEREVDSELQCPSCSTLFQVYGIFGYCPGCREENIIIYDTNWSIIKREIDSAENTDRALRHAYSDLVSTFEIFCQRKASRIISERCHFQVLFEARRFFKKHLSVDILHGLSHDELLALRRVFQKRHAYIHAGGKITEKYIKMIPEDSALLNSNAELLLEELELASKGMRTSLSTLVKAIEPLG